MSFMVAIAALWIAFYSYWLISALGVKKAVRGTPWWKGAGLRILLVIGGVLLLRLFRIHRHVEHRAVVTSHPVVHSIGLVLCVSGLTFAVWARLHLGRNWGIPMSLKEGHELVTTGPYRFVRHPIYTGILLAIIGSALVVGLPWLVAFIVVCAYFVYSARTEERLMMQTFPDAYPDYQKRTSAMIPGVW
jgi:protein-S-isoprenylcysteine O-methyltransferase Ste14